MSLSSSQSSDLFVPSTALGGRDAQRAGLQACVHAPSIKYVCYWRQCSNISLVDLDGYMEHTGALGIPSLNRWLHAARQLDHGHGRIHELM